MKVFISYRRSTGAMLARLMKTELKYRGYDVFLDYDNLNARGGFNVQLLHAIEAADHFLLVLSAHALDGCCEADDWVRQEIAHALRLKKNIIAIKTADFVYPDVLPPDIEPILLRHAPTYSDEWADAFMNKVCGMMKEAPAAANAAPIATTAAKSAPRSAMDILADMHVWRGAVGDEHRRSGVLRLQQPERCSATASSHALLRCFSGSYSNVYP